VKASVASAAGSGLHLAKDSTREGQHCSDSTYLGESTLVSSPTATVEWIPTVHPNLGERDDFTNSPGAHNAIRSSSASPFGHCQEFLQIRRPFGRCFMTIGGIMGKQNNINQ